MATGLSVPNQVDFPGSEYVDGYESMSVDPKDFVGQNVLILGRGNSAFETAENILGVTNFIHMLSRSRVRLSWATHYVGDLRYAGQVLCVLCYQPLTPAQLTALAPEASLPGTDVFLSPDIPLGPQGHQQWPVGHLPTEVPGRAARV